MTVHVVSGFHPEGYALYGKTFLETFHRHWPADVTLAVYAEEPVEMPRGECRSLWNIPGARDFIDRHSKIPEHCGTKPVPGWRAKNIRRGYEFRYDAVRWCRQCFIPEAAAEGLPDGDILVWSDADVVYFADPPANHVENLIGKNDVLHLGRDKRDSEIGFYAIRLSNLTRHFLAAMARHFREETVFGLGEWHSGYVFDRCLDDLRRNTGSVRSLAEHWDGHVWMTVPELYTFSDHLKGRRKFDGHSSEHPLKWWERRA